MNERCLLFNEKTGHILNTEECVYVFEDYPHEAKEFKNYDAARKYLDRIGHKHYRLVAFHPDFNE